jgi:hypothetical protein
VTGCVDATIALRGRPRQRRAPAAPACGSSNTCQRGIPNPTATHRVAPTTPGPDEPNVGCASWVFHAATASATRRPRQCRGDPVGRPFGAPRALGPRRLVRGRRAQGCQGDAPRRPYMTCCACSRVRWASEHRKHLAAPVVGAVREPPLHRPAGPWCERGDRRPCAGDRFQGTAAPCLYREWLHNGYKTAAGPLVVSGKPLKNQGRV